MKFTFISKCDFAYLLELNALNIFNFIENGFLLKSLLYDYDHVVAHYMNKTSHICCGMPAR